MQPANQFTPDQLIVAGRRAEAQGQPAYAMQFYRYVAEHFPQSTEAYEARDAMFRLTPPSEQAARQPATATAYGAPTQQHAPVQHASLASLGEVRPHHEAAIEPVQRARAEARAEGRTERAKVRAAPPIETQAQPALRPARGYRIGRVVAAMLNTIGWLSLLGAIAVVPLMIAALTVTTFPKGIKETIAGNLLTVSGGALGLLLIGLFAIFAAQVARATFDTADATRALFEANVGSG